MSSIVRHPPHGHGLAFKNAETNLNDPVKNTRAGEAGSDGVNNMDDAYEIAMTMAKNDAAKVYQGDGFRSGEIGYTPCALRAYPDFESLWQAQDNAFPLLARRLYGPLFHALKGTS